MAYRDFADALADDPELMDLRDTGAGPMPRRGTTNPDFRSIEDGDWARTSGGVFDPVEEPVPHAAPQGRGGSFLDNFAENIAAGRITAPTRRENSLETFLHALIGSGAEGFARTRISKRDDEKATQSAISRAGAARNTRNLQASEDARAARIASLKKSSEEEKADRRTREGYIIIQPWLAKALGDETLAGKGVSAAKYSELRAGAKQKAELEGGGKTRIRLDDRELARLHLPPGTILTVAELAEMRRVINAGEHRSGGGAGGEDALAKLPPRVKYQLDTLNKRLNELNGSLDRMTAGQANAVGTGKEAYSSRIAANEAARDKILGQISAIEKKNGLSMDGDAPAPETVLVSPPSATPAMDDSAREGKIAQLRREGEAAKGELKATGALAGERRAAARATLNRVEKEVTSLGSSLNQLSNRQGLAIETQAPAPTAATQRTIDFVKSKKWDERKFESWLNEDVGGLTRAQAFAQEGVQVATVRKAVRGK